MESLLLLFTDSLPCWDEETVKISGENPNGLKSLAESGDLLPIAGGYTLTEKGVIMRENAAKDLFLPVTPTEIISDESEARNLLEINRTAHLLPTGA